MSALRTAVNWAKGGEGAVYDIEEFVDSVAKIYHTPPPALKQDKLAFMAATADAQLLNYVARRRQRFTVDEAERLSVL